MSLTVIDGTLTPREVRGRGADTLAELTPEVLHALDRGADERARGASRAARPEAPRRHGRRAGTARRDVRGRAGERVRPGRLAGRQTGVAMADAERIGRASARRREHAPSSSTRSGRGRSRWRRSRRSSLAREVPAEIAGRSSRRRVRLGYLDDAELAGQLARGYRSRGYGRRRASVGLRRRRIAPVEAEAALDSATASRTKPSLPLRRWRAAGRGRPRAATGGRVPRAARLLGRCRLAGRAVTRRADE